MNEINSNDVFFKTQYVQDITITTHNQYLLRWPGTRAVKEFTKRRKCGEHSSYFTFPGEGKGWLCIGLWAFIG